MYTPSKNTDSTFYLYELPFFRSLLKNQEVRPLCELSNPDTEVTLDAKVVGHYIILKSKYPVHPDDIQGYYIMSSKKRQYELATRQAYYGMFPKWVRDHFSNLKMRMSQKQNIAELIEMVAKDIVKDQIGIIADTYKAALKEFVDRLNVLFKMDKRSKYLMYPKDYDRKQYLMFSYLYLEQAFGGENNWFDMRENDVPILKRTPQNPMGMMMIAHQVWWMIHLIHPRLGQCFQQYISSVTRKDFEHPPPMCFTHSQNFVEEFWNAWQIKIKLFSATYLHYIRAKFKGDENIRKLATDCYKEYSTDKAVSTWKTAYLHHLVEEAKHDEHGDTKLSKEINLEPDTMTFMLPVIWSAMKKD
jgi:hypothetical protein